MKGVAHYHPDASIRAGLGFLSGYLDVLNAVIKAVSGWLVKDGRYFMAALKK